MIVLKGIGHADHGVSVATASDALNALADLPAEGFFIRTVTLPEGHADLSDALYGPMSGDDAVSESDVHYAVRGERTGASRMIAKPARATRLLTLIGMRDAEGVFLYTAFGGRLAEREPFDPGLKTEEEKEKAQAFWAVHALAA
jgi:hypothetical protein